MRIGIVGGGQLGRMLGLAGAPLGLDCVFLDPSANACAGIVGELITAEFTDPGALDALAARADVVTVEFENVDIAELERVAATVPVYPPPRAVAVSQCRHREKAFFESLGLAVAPWGYAVTAEDVAPALARTGLPAILKTDRLGYDGKGQIRVRTAEQAHSAFAELGGVPVCIEGFVDFDREVSVIGSRSPNGITTVYPLTENHHRDGVLFHSRATANDPLGESASDAFRRTVTALDYVGTLAIEFFVVDGQLVVNEFAPRVHNSGHWTQDGAVTSQFENHLRAVAGLPLGDSRAIAHSGMQNFLGALPRDSDILAHGSVRLHAYGKAPRPGRKVGHANVVARDREELDKCMEYLAKLAENSTHDAR